MLPLSIPRFSPLFPEGGPLLGLTVGPAYKNIQPVWLWTEEEVHTPGVTDMTFSNQSSVQRGCSDTKETTGRVDSIQPQDPRSLESSLSLCRAVMSVHRDRYTTDGVTGSKCTSAEKLCVSGATWLRWQQDSRWQSSFEKKRVTLKGFYCASVIRVIRQTIKTCNKE